MIDKLRKIREWRNITPLRIPELISVHTSLFGRDKANEYDNCKCVGVLRDMRADIVEYLVKRDNP